MQICLLLTTFAVITAWCFITLTLFLYEFRTLHAAQLIPTTALGNTLPQVHRKQQRSQGWTLYLASALLLPPGDILTIRCLTIHFFLSFSRSGEDSRMQLLLLSIQCVWFFFFELVSLFVDIKNHDSTLSIIFIQMHSERLLNKEYTNHCSPQHVTNLTLLYH